MIRTVGILALALPAGLLIALCVRALMRTTNREASNSLIFNVVRAIFGGLVAAAMINFGVTGQASWPIAIGLALLPALLALWFVRRAILAARRLGARV